MLANQIQMHSTAKSVLLPHILSGKLRALAVEGDKRWPELPDVPTLTEAGFDGFPPAIWYGFLAPAGTPQAVIDKLNTAVNKQLKMPETQAAMAKLGLDIKMHSPQEFGAILADEMRLWAAVAQQTGIKLTE